MIIFNEGLKGISMRAVISILLVLLSYSAMAADSAEVRQYARFALQGNIYHGLIQGDQITPITNSVFEKEHSFGKSIPLASVELLVPTDAQKVFAVGMNFASHLSSPSNAPPPLFLKLPTSLIPSGEDIVLPNDATNVHFEGELVLVIGKKTKNISEADADNAIFGVLVGNDLTERSWQSRDLQWMRSKASDGFGPVSTRITTGLDYNNLQLTTRLNGKVVQDENTELMIHSPAKVVSYLSRYFTLLPGDLIFYMGTPDQTQALKNGDVVTVTIDQVGTLENTIRTE